MKNQSRCLICGKGKLVPRVRDEVVDWQQGAAKLSVKVPRVPIEVCDKCGEVYSGPPAAKKKNRYVAKELGLLSAEEIRQVRRSLAPSRSEFCRLTGIPADELISWEESKGIPDADMDRYLRTLGETPNDCRAFLAIIPPSLRQLWTAAHGS